MNSLRHTVLDRLVESQVYRDYERAFGEATGLPLALCVADDWHLTHHGNRHENPLCAYLSTVNKSCAACLQTQHDLNALAREQTRTITCYAGLCETAVPLQVGGRVIGFLRTGEVMAHEPSEMHYRKVLKSLKNIGVDLDLDRVREAYFHTPVMSARRYESVLMLLQIFAQHLSMVAGQIVFQSENDEMPAITRAREFILLRHAENLTLGSVAAAVHMSTFYFCKQFKRTTGLSFTEYLSGVRIQQAREEMLKPHARVSEVAYTVGFQSLTHFNRVFKKLNGESPTVYRARMCERLRRRSLGRGAAPRAGSAASRR